ncbi:MAG: hypothetical protein SFU85_07230 [Candidatus Methylacidiphilales bacterium]|nr:hypothetical protein [Candidatus Methylacidiphilales bacterium]
METTQTPSLAAPGAGLPPLELLFGRMLFKSRTLAGNPESFKRTFQIERARIHQHLDTCPPIARGRKVLITRAFGMEDSSRHWSLWMTLDHLRIVNGSIARIISSLGSGSIPEGRASTADVKPSPAADSSVEAPYEASCEAVLEAADFVADLKTPLRFAHPWFGPMDAFEWYALAGGHMGIHRVQIERIIAGLAAKAGPR